MELVKKKETGIDLEGYFAYSGAIQFTDMRPPTPPKPDIPITPPTPEKNTYNVTVQFEDSDKQPITYDGSVSVNLTKNGTVILTKEANKENSFKVSFEYVVTEDTYGISVNKIDGYTSGITNTGNNFTVIMTKDAVVIPPEPEITNVTWTSATADGESETATSTLVNLVFDKAITGLTVDNFTITGATKGELTDNNDGNYTLGISDITVDNGSNITISITNPPSYNITPSSMEVVVYKKVEAPPEPSVKNVTWEEATQAGGEDGTKDTTAINLLFSEAIPDLVFANFTVIGATANALTPGSDGIQVLEISDITVNNGDTIKISIANPDGYSITPSEKDVVVYKNVVQSVNF